MIKYKTELNGNEFITTEEAFTSRHYIFCGSVDKKSRAHHGDMYVDIAKTQGKSQRC